MHKLVYIFLNCIRSSTNILICTLFNSVHFNKKNETKFYWNKLCTNYDNEVSVYNVHKKLLAVDSI